MTALAYRGAVAGFRRAHARLREHTCELEVAARELPELSHDEQLAVLGRIVNFLDHDLMPHLTADLEVLYPALEMHLRPGALDRMARDHARAVDLERRLITTGATDTTALQEALYDLQGLLETHFRKEEEIFLPLLADESDEELERISTAATRAAESGRRERMVA